MVRNQIEAVLGDIRPEVVKTGMLSNTAIIRAVASSLKERSRIPLVLDPVMVSKSGNSLLESDAVATLKDFLFPLADLITPNIPEAEALTGKTLTTDGDLEKAARLLHTMGSRAVLIKGGHRPRLQAEAGAEYSEVVDLLYDGQEFHTIRGPWVNTPHTHGTGCTLSAAIAAGLAQGLELYTAILNARTYLTKALAVGFAIGEGTGPVHHFHHFWPARP
jgi:hydroxymethylpyrimidine/phosphomethylpyrimidine kinase